MFRRSFSVCLLLLGCSNGEEPPPNSPPAVSCDPQVCPFPYSSFNGASPTVSLRKDLLANRTERPGGGVLRRACSASSCHGDSAQAGLYLGPPLRDLETGQDVPLTTDHVERMLGTQDGVMRPSGTNPSIKLVVPLEPANSFLMRKIDGCLDDIASGCTALEPGTDHACGDRMPQGGATLCSDERDMIRRWIAQGARDDG